MKFSLFRWMVSCASLFLICFSSYASNQFTSTLKSSNNKLTYYSDLIKSGKVLTDQQANEVVEIAKARQKALFEYLNDKNKVESFLLPMQVVNVLPNNAKPFVEKEIVGLIGTLEIRAATTAENKETLQYILLSGNDIYYLNFTDKIPGNLKTGDKIRINRAIQFIRDSRVNELILSEKNLTTIQPAPAKPLSFGPQKTITFLVNFSDQPSNRPWTPTAINTLMYTDINRMFYESSYQQTTIVGQVVGWYVLSVASNTPCSTLTDLVSAQADQAATNAGVDLSQYTRKVYIFPKTSMCGWAGLGNVGGSTTRSWINGAASSIRTPGHELGHNLGVYHSKLLTCSASPNEGTCNRIEYGDGTDIMGAGRQTHFNAFQKFVLGWVGYNVSPPVTLVTTSGTYKIDSYETKNNNPKALRILKRAGTADYYFLEYRRGIGFDAELASCSGCDYTKGVVFHQGNINSTNSSDLLDMSWTDHTNGRVALLPGQSWRDPQAPNGGVTFTVVSVDSTSATVKIDFGSAK